MENLNTQENINEPKTPKTTKEKVIFGLKIAGNAVFYVIIGMLLLFSIMNINAGSRNGGFPNIFGKGFLSVASDSMDGNCTEYEIDSFKQGDLVYEKVFKDEDCSNLKVGDVITFYDPAIKALNTHRIVYVHSDYSYVICQGDKIVMNYADRIFDKENPLSSHNAELEDAGEIQNVLTQNIKGVVTGVNEGAGKVLTNIQNNWLWYFVIPVLVFLLVEVYFVNRNIMELKGAKQKAELASDKEAMLADLEAQKEEMRKQLLAELMAEKEAKAKDTLEAPNKEEAVINNEEAEASNDQEVTEKTE